MYECHLLSPVSIAPFVHVFRTDPLGSGGGTEMVLPPSAAVDYL